MEDINKYIDIKCICFCSFDESEYNIINSNNENIFKHIKIENKYKDYFLDNVCLLLDIYIKKYIHKYNIYKIKFINKNDNKEIFKIKKIIRIRNDKDTTSNTEFASIFKIKYINKYSIKNNLKIFIDYEKPILIGKYIKQYYNKISDTYYTNDKIKDILNKQLKSDYNYLEIKNNELEDDNKKLLQEKEELINKIKKIEETYKITIK